VQKSRQKCMICTVLLDCPINQCRSRISAVISAHKDRRTVLISGDASYRKQHSLHTAFAFHVTVHPDLSLSQINSKQKQDRVVNNNNTKNILLGNCDVQCHPEIPDTKCIINVNDHGTIPITC